MALTTKLRSFSFDEISKISEDSKEFSEISTEIVHEFKNVGFLRLENIPGFNDEEFLEQIKWFHALTFQEKMKMSLKRFQPENLNEYRGYMPLVDGVKVYKEQTDFGNNEFLRNPSDDPCESFMKDENSYPKSEKFESVIEKFYKMYFQGKFILIYVTVVDPQADGNLNSLVSFSSFFGNILNHLNFGVENN